MTKRRKDNEARQDRAQAQTSAFLTAVDDDHYSQRSGTPSERGARSPEKVRAAETSTVHSFWHEESAMVKFALSIIRELVRVINVYDSMPSYSAVIEIYVCVRFVGNFMEHSTQVPSSFEVSDVDVCESVSSIAIGEYSVSEGFYQNVFVSNLVPAQVIRQMSREKLQGDGDALEKYASRVRVPRLDPNKARCLWRFCESLAEKRVRSFLSSRST